MLGGWRLRRLHLTDRGFEKDSIVMMIMGSFRMIFEFENCFCNLIHTHSCDFT